MNPAARDPNPIEQSKTQIDNYLVRPEFFEVQSWDTAQSVGGQTQNDAEAEKRSNQKSDRGSGRAQGDVNNTGRA